MRDSQNFKLASPKKEDDNGDDDDERGGGYHWFLAIVTFVVLFALLGDLLVMKHSKVNGTFL